MCYSNRLKHMVPELFDDGEDLLVRPWTIAGGLAFIRLQLPLLSLEDKIPVTHIQVHTIEFVNATSMGTTDDKMVDNVGLIFAALPRRSLTFLEESTSQNEWRRFKLARVWTLNSFKPSSFQDDN